LSFFDDSSDNKYKAGTDLVFKETGSNTGIFELGVIVNGTADANNAAFSVSSFPSSITFTFTDHEVYGRYGSDGANIVNQVGYGVDAGTMLAQSPYNQEKSTSSTPSLTVQLRNSDGRIDLAAPLTIANGFQIKVTDPDRNIDTTARDVPHTAVLNTTSPTSTPGSDTNALDGNVNYNITHGATGLKVTTTGPASGTITLKSTLTFTVSGGTSPAITGVSATIPSGSITINAAPSGFNVTSTSGTATVTSGTTIQTTVTIGFSTTSAGTFTIADNTNPITVTVSGITVSGSPTAATLSSVSTTATILTSGINLNINDVRIPVVFKETDDNTGVFLPDLAGNKIQIVPVANDPAGAAPDPDQVIVTPNKIVLGSDNKVYVLASAISEDIDLTISYIDPAGDPRGPKEFKIIRKIQHFAGDISTTTTSVPVTGRAVIEINDMDLNLNPDAIDIYTLTINDNNNPVASFNGLAELKVKVNGKDTVDFASDATIQLVETGANTGIFRGEFRVNRITDTDTTVSGIQALSDGDKITFEYKDLTESPALTRSVDVRVGKPSGTVELDRSSYPPTTSLGTTKLHITITDPPRNTSSSSTDVLTLTGGTMKIELIKGSTRLTFNPNASLGFPTSANETGINTGVFTVDVNLPANVDVDASNNVIGVNVATPDHVIDDGWQIRVIYKDSNGDDQTATATVTTNTAQITTDKPTYDLGQTIILRVVEPDWNFDSDKVDEINLSTLGSDFVVNSDKVSDRQLATLGTISGISLDPSSTIRETGKNTGIFEIQIKNINSNLVSRGKNLEFTYTDKTPSGGGTEIEVKHTVLITSATVDIIFDKETYTPFDRVLVSIVDPAANQDPDTKDKLTGDARVRVIVGGTSQPLTPDFEETEANSGVFRYKPNDKGILITGINPNAKPGDGIRVEYRSPDKQTEISKSVQIVFTNGSISLDKDSYKPNETVVITINDPDENRNPDIPDQFEVKVVSTTDPTGIKVTVRETGDRTGVFKAEVILTTGLSSGNRLQVREGDQITAIYTDETLPNAQTINQQLVNRNQVGLRTLQTLDVQASAVVGVLLAPTERTTVAKPSLRDQAGNVLQQASVDVPVSIASSIKNNTQQPQKFVYIVQVKDADGFVVSISTVGGTLPAGQSFDVSASWTPTAAGTYTVEVFVWSELGKPSPLSKVETATVRVV
jgi:hypothetical protein